MPKAKPAKRVYARWLTQILPENISDIYIQAGCKSHDWDSFEPADAGAQLSIKHIPLGYEIEFSAPSCGLEKEKGYWLSPALLCDKHEALDYGIGQDIALMGRKKLEAAAHRFGWTED